MHLWVSRYGLLPSLFLSVPVDHAFSFPSYMPEPIRFPERFRVPFSPPPYSTKSSLIILFPRKKKSAVCCTSSGMPSYCLQDCHYFYRTALRGLNISTYVSPLYA